jgi:YVTN family beta-propeller protein
MMGGKSCRIVVFCVLVGLLVPIGRISGQGLLVVNSEDAQAVLVDPGTQEIVARFPTGPDPREVALSPDGRYAYVTSYFGGAALSAEAHLGDAPPPANGTVADSSGFATVTVLDLASRTVLTTFRPGPFGQLHGIWVGHSGERLWMTAEADSGIVELNARTGEVLMLWKTGGAMSHTVIAGPGNRRVYVANGSSGSITVIDRFTVVPTRIRTGQGPEGLALSPNGAELWVSNRGDNTVTVIDTDGLTELARFPSGGLDPVRLRFHPDGAEVWVANRGTAAVLETIDLAVEPRSIVFSAAGDRAFVSSPRSHEVYMIDVATRTVLGSFRSGSAPHGLAWSDWGGARAEASR